MTTNHPEGRDGMPMTMERLRAILGAYGASPARWPHPEREAAETLLDRSAEARVLLSEATQLDAMLDMVHSQSPSAVLGERVRDRRFGWRGLKAVLWGEAMGADITRWMLSPKHQAVAVAGALLFGVLLGAGLPDADHVAQSVSSPKAVTATSVAAAPRNAGSVGIETASRTVNEIEVTEIDTAGQQYSSNSDPAYDAPDPFGAAAHGMDMVEGARLATGPVPQSGEPLGSIPLL